MPRALASPADPNDASSLISRIRSAAGKRQRDALERALEQLPDPEVVPALIKAVQSERSPEKYRILTRLLAARGGDGAIEELSRQASDNRRFPKLAVRALAWCDHPERVPLLVQLVRTGRTRQWQAAIEALARINQLDAIEPLCQIIVFGPDAKRRFAHTALRKMGRPQMLALRAMRDPKFSESACARIIVALDALPVYLFPLALRAFDGERFLTRLAGQAGIAAGRAEDVLERFRHHKTLLRASAPAEQDRLLRASASSSKQDPEALLRAANATDDAAPASSRSWLLVLLARLFGLRQGGDRQE